MADETPPLDETRLEAMRRRLVEHIDTWYGPYSFLRDDIPALLAEVERLRAREAAVMAIVRDVATEDTLAYEGDAGDDYRCVFCGGHFDWGDGEQHSIPTREQLIDVPRALVHTPDCPVTKARALLSEGE